MPNNYLDILEKWGAYSRYDRNQNQFNLLSANYEFHKVGKMIETILNEYDESGKLAVLYAKINFEMVMRKCSTDLWTILSNPQDLEEERAMYSLFQSDIVRDAEVSFVRGLNLLYQQVTKGRLIGSSEEDIQTLLPYLDTVLGQMGKLNTDLFAGNGCIGNISHIDSALHVFETMAECLLSLEKADDGFYFTLIRAMNSDECYFCFMIKSNGTILSINDRADEAYIGQHRVSRNGRWTEGKADKIFPYDYLFDYGEHDYKGYATSYKFKEDVNLYDMGIDAFMPVIIAMVLTIGKYQNKKIDKERSYIDSFLPVHAEKIDKYDLIDTSGSSLYLEHQNVDIHFDNSRLINGGYTDEFTWKSGKNYKETGSFSNSAQEMIDLWGIGFVPDYTKLFPQSNVKSLTDKTKEVYTPEYIGSEKRIRKQIYKEFRWQLAQYMQENIYNEWVTTGKTEAVKRWYYEALRNNQENIYRIFMELEEKIKSGEEKPTTYGWRRIGNYTIYIVNDTYPSSIHCHLTQDQLINVDPKGRYNDYWVDKITGNKCNLWFVVRPSNYKHIEEFCGCEVPKIVKGWKEDRRESGNSLLSSTDATESVRTPFEIKYESSIFTHEKDKDEEMKKWEGADFNFRFAFGFSKRGWNQIKKSFLK